MNSIKSFRCFQIFLKSLRMLPFQIRELILNPTGNSWKRNECICDATSGSSCNPVTTKNKASKLQMEALKPNQFWPEAKNNANSAKQTNWKWERISVRDFDAISYYVCRQTKQIKKTLEQILVWTFLHKMLMFVLQTAFKVCQKGEQNCSLIYLLAG